MSIPKILYYAKLEYCADKNRKTPKYKVVEQAGFYQPMEALRGRDGCICFYLMEKLKEGLHVPSVRLQAKGSLNFTGLKDYFIDGRLSGYAYGYPLDTKTYSKDKKANPFYAYRQDGFLFKIHQDKTLNNGASQVLPTCIELIVLEGAKILTPSYCKQLSIGGFNETLEALRKQAKREMSL